MENFGASCEKMIGLFEHDNCKGKIERVGPN